MIAQHRGDVIVSPTKNFHIFNNSTKLANATRDDPDSLPSAMATISIQEFQQRLEVCLIPSLRVYDLYYTLFNVTLKFLCILLVNN